MTTYWNTKFTTRDPECATVAIKADRLPSGYDPAIWKTNGMDIQDGIEVRKLETIYHNGERFEKYGYL